jgi:hypothetical protein
MPADGIAGPATTDQSCISLILSQGRGYQTETEGQRKETDEPGAIHELGRNFYKTKVAVRCRAINLFPNCEGRIV